MLFSFRKHKPRPVPTLNVGMSMADGSGSSKKDRSGAVDISCQSEVKESDAATLLQAESPFRAPAQPNSGEIRKQDEGDGAADEEDESKSLVQYCGKAEAEQCIIEIAKSVMGHTHKVLNKNGKPTRKTEKIWMLGSCTAILKVIFEPLNKLPVWNWQLKFSSLESRW